MAVSSSKRAMFVCGDFGMSDVYMLNNVGPSIDPCGTPAKIGWKEEKLSFILTETLSKALEMSMKTAQV
ncbi:unnamed protein product [Macrosiphum euphorbiae]|uniref:Uncharacterized protein n=1 Tax=Macrosiphum euphorbiae TaxID=13131 RepID=A0AAV0WZK3_9HEMI|nr:unnamed protein product [Macrosiphum euphorbiae]